MSELADWLNLFLRWFHLVAGISWIGSSFYFMWLDSHLEVGQAEDGDDVEGKLWMVHSGGFYRVEKKLIRAENMPRVLHWFKWEAFFTWLSGIFLMGIVYYWGASVYLLDPEIAKITATQAVVISLGLIALSWWIYDTVWSERLAPLEGRNFLAHAISVFLVIGLSLGLCHLFSGRGAYLHLGAIFGTLMVANVWFRILPAQQQMIDATKRNETPNYRLGKQAKRRSVHNSYFTLPVLFIMLSHHYPFTYGHALNWVVLLLMVLLGAGIRHLMLRKSLRSAWMILLAGAGLILTMSGAFVGKKVIESSDGVSFLQVRQILNQRCVSCHSAHPTDSDFAAAPGGVSFDSDQEVVQRIDRIKLFAVTTNAMPLGNKTQMTGEERAVLGQWIAEGGRLD